MERTFKGIWIPAHIYLDDQLTPTEKFLLSEIWSYTGKQKGCELSNENLAAFLKISERQVRKIVARLVSLGYIKAFRDGKERILSVSYSEPEPPYSEPYIEDMSDFDDETHHLISPDELPDECFCMDEPELEFQNCGTGVPEDSFESQKAELEFRQSGTGVPTGGTGVPQKRNWSSGKVELEFRKSGTGVPEVENLNMVSAQNPAVLSEIAELEFQKQKNSTTLSIINNYNKNKREGILTQTKSQSTGQRRTYAKRPPFVKPSVQAIRDYALSNQYNIDPEKFYDYYESNGWVVGKSKMVDWQATVRNWHRRTVESSQQRRRSEPDCPHMKPGEKFKFEGE